MKFLRLFAGVAMVIAVLVACNSSKKSSKNTSSNRKKDPVAADAALKIGNMLDRLATDLIGATTGKADIFRTAQHFFFKIMCQRYFRIHHGSLHGLWNLSL